MEKEKLKDSTENYLFRIIALERNGNHDEAMRFFNKLLGNNLAAKDIHEIRRFLKETERNGNFRESGRHSAYKRAFHSKYPTRKKRSRSRKKKSANKRFGGMLREISWPLLSGFLAGLYVSVFYITNNFTMLPGASIIALFLVLTVPSVALVIIAFGVFKIIRKNSLIPAGSIVASVAYMLLILHPAITKFGLVSSLLSFLGGADSLLANLFYVVVPASLLAFIFKGDIKKFSFVLGVMVVAVFVMNLSGLVDAVGPGIKSNWANWQKYRNIKLSKKPNIFFIVPDSYGSVAFMRDLKIDISDFQQFLTDQKFRIYDDTFSNYQPTTNSLPAFLNMEHHYYTVTKTNYSEVDKSARVMIGGNNNFFRVLKANGYTRQIIHQGTYVLLQGHSADYCYPQINEYAGAKIVLGRILSRDLLTDDEKVWNDYGAEKVHEKVIENLSDKSAPVAQYIHLFGPGHSPSAVAYKCDEQKEVDRYADRIKRSNIILENLITDIINNDPEAVIVLVGDHGPFTLNKCNCESYINIKLAEQVRDRASILTAIRWPEGYDGRYDSRIKTSVNFLRFVLASLAENETEIIKTAVPDDVYVKMKNYRKNHDFFKIIENGEILAQPKNLNIPEHLRAPN